MKTEKKKFLSQIVCFIEPYVINHTISVYIFVISMNEQISFEILK